MELIRRDTDYAFRLAAQLATAYGEDTALSARVLAEDNDVSYALACKILQKLTHAGIVESVMGPKGGFRLAKKPEKIAFSQLIEAVQGPVTVNKCLMGGFKCPRKGKCPARPKMAELQNKINGYLNGLTLKEFVETGADNG
ncbi:MAG: RrF2 family transcriptional regulator [Planctomycetota bacterium]|jgi:Rrf2 family protein